MGYEHVSDDFDALLMGNVSEEVSESNEQFQARIAAAQAQLQKIQKDENKAHTFDLALARIIPQLPKDILQMVIFLINQEIPSLTILAFLSLSVDEAGRICYEEFHRFVEEPADFSMIRFSHSHLTEKISWWWTFIVAADYVSTTVRLRSFREQERFVRNISTFLSRLLENLLSQYPEEDLTRDRLHTILKKYSKELFEEPTS